MDAERDRELHRCLNMNYHTRTTWARWLACAMALCVASCRDKAERPPALYLGNLGQSDLGLGDVGADSRPLMPTTPVEIAPDILNDARTTLPEIEMPAIQEVVQLKETPEAIYQAFKHFVEIAPTDFQNAMGIGGTFHPDDNKVLTGETVMKIPELIELFGKIEARLKEKWPEQVAKLRQKLTRVYFGSSMKYSAGDPPGILLTVGSPVGRPNRYFVPILKQGERYYVTWGFVDLQSKMYHLTDEVTALYEQLGGETLTEEAFEKKAEELIASFLRMPFEDNPELSNIKGRRSTPLPEDAEGPTAHQDADEKGTSDGKSAQTEQRPAGQEKSTSGGTSLMGGLMKAARSALQKTGPKEADTPAVSTDASKNQPKTSSERQDDESGQDADGTPNATKKP